MTTSTTQLTHAEGVERIKRYRLAENPLLVLTEPRAPRVYEEPDCLTVSEWGDTFIDDWKCSIADLRADREKLWRRAGNIGMGTRRTYWCEQYVIEPHQIDDDWGWGLIWWDESNSRATVMKESLPWKKMSTTKTIILLASHKWNELRTGESGADGDRAKPSQQRRVRREWVPFLIELCMERERVDCREAGAEIIQRFGVRGKPGTIANWIRQDVERGLVEGIRAVKAGRTYIELDQQS